MYSHWHALNARDNHYDELNLQQTWGLQYSSSQLNTEPESSLKLATDMDASKDTNSASIICWNYNMRRKNTVYWYCVNIQR